MREHLGAWCETPHVFADLGHDASRFDAECERWLLADVPFASADDLVPISDPGRAHRRRRARHRTTPALSAGEAVAAEEKDAPVEFERSPSASSTSPEVPS